MLMLPLAVLVPILILFWITLDAWIRVLGHMLAARFFAAAARTCIGIFLIDVLNMLLNVHQWADFTSVYVVLLLVGLGAEAAKFVRAERA